MSQSLRVIVSVGRALVRWPQATRPSDLVGSKAAVEHDDDPVTEPEIDASRRSTRAPTRS